MTETGKTEIIRFIIKAIITIASHMRLYPDIADVINKGNEILKEL